MSSQSKNNSLYQRSIVSIKDISASELKLIIKTANFIKKKPQPDLLKNKLIASCFFEPSTRTRLSFESAVRRLGGDIVGFSDVNNTSTTKGETLADSIRMISAYSDAIIMRHPQEGAARFADQHASVPIINGGDGANQHPSQTMLDLFSIHETQSTLQGLKIAMVGDLKYGRTVHSLTQALAKFSANQFYFIAPDALQMPKAILQQLEQQNISYQQLNQMQTILPEIDILYMTRIQKERLDASEYAHIQHGFRLNVQMLHQVKENLRILHPLPRVDEILYEVDQTPYAYYFQQAENGLYVRQALLALIFHKKLFIEETLV